MSEVADLIEKAVEVIDAEGWTQGRYHNTDNYPQVSHCMLGGLFKAATGKEITTCVNDSFREAANILNDAIPGFEFIADWNDVPGRTWGECRDLMLGVVKDLRNGEGSE